MNEVRNTERALKDQALLVSSFWCYVGIHSWTKWGNAEPGKHLSYGIRIPKFFQYRKCSHCNKISVRMVKTITPE